MYWGAVRVAWPRLALAWIIACAALGPLANAGVNDVYSRRTTWQDTLLTTRQALQAASLSEKERRECTTAIWQSLQEDFPVPWDWTLQDHGAGLTNWFSVTGGTEIEEHLVECALQDLGGAGAARREELDDLRQSHAPASDRRWLHLYARVCEERRGRRLQTLLQRAPRIVFTKRFTLRPSFFGYTEGQSDAQNERHFRPGSALCLLEMEGLHGKVRTLLDDATGTIRDPAVSWDAKRVLFAWKKSLDEDDYHLYDLEPATGRVRQLTSGLGFADYEPAYLPNGDIIFTSTRCVQTVDCWWTEVSNLYSCDPDGRFLRRLGFDQVHTFFPTVTDDGRVVYTRWDYNDRGQMFPQPGDGFYVLTPRHFAPVPRLLCAFFLVTA